MRVRHLLLALVLAGLSIAGFTAYATMYAPAAADQGGQEQPGQGKELLVENVEFENAVLMGAHRGQAPGVLYTLTVHGPRHTTILAYAFVFTGIAELANRTPIAIAKANSTTWAHTDFHVIRRDGRPVGLAMAFKNKEPIYIEYKDPSYGESGYYNVSIAFVLMAFYHPRLRETVMAVHGATVEGNATFVSYSVHGGVILAAAFRVKGWPSGPEGTRLAVGFHITLRAAAWLYDRDGEGIRARVKWVAPFCGSTRPRLQRTSGLIRRAFAFKNTAIVREGDNRTVVRAFCVYQVKGRLLRLAIVVPKAEVVAYPALRAGQGQASE